MHAVVIGTRSKSICMGKFELKDAVLLARALARFHDLMENGEWDYGEADLWLSIYSKQMSKHVTRKGIEEMAIPRRDKSPVR